MSGTPEIEKQQAAREARDAVASRPRGATAAATEAALRRHLEAEAYREKRREESEPEDGENHR